MADLFSANSPRNGFRLVMAMLGMIALPAALTLHTVRAPGPFSASTSNPSPHGYTVSLLMFIVPILVIGLWFVPREGVRISKRAFVRTIAILFPMGAALDFFFARSFFTFPNPGATLGIAAPALGGGVPIEEYVFYLTGFTAVLLIYVWLDEFWLAAYNIADYAGESKKISRLLQFHPTSAVVGALLIVMAVVYKKMFSPVPDGFPGYFTFLVLGAFIPAASFFPTARPFINWRAFSLTLFILVLVSLLWEATLAVPYQWWGFRPAQMTGLFIGAWAGLPIEEVGVWIAVSYATVIVFEIFKLWQASGKKAKHAFLGGD